MAYRPIEHELTPKWVELNIEIFKIGLQLVGVGVLGGAAKLLYERYAETRERNYQQKILAKEQGIREAQEELERRDRRRDRLRDFLKALVAAYQQTKRSRRLLRARGFRVEGAAKVIQVAAYDQLLSSVSDGQLSLESLLREVESANPNQFPEAEKVKALLAKMERYLGELITEWEESLPLLDNSLPNAAALHKLEDFVAKLEDANFHTDFADPYKEIHALITKAIQDLTPAAVVRTATAAGLSDDSTSR